MNVSRRAVSDAKKPKGRFVRKIWRTVMPNSMRRAAGFLLRPAALEFTLRTSIAHRNRPGDGPPALVGFFSGASGIARSVQLASHALTELGVEHRCIDVRDLSAPTVPDTTHASAWIFYLNPPELTWLLYHWGSRRFFGPRYAYWAWELPSVPNFWLRAAAMLNAVMVPSRYTAEAMSASPTPVVITPHPMRLADCATVRRNDIRRPEDPFRVVSLFDFKSSVARKNPFGALEAFQRAFGDDARRRLVFKTHNGHETPELLRAIQMRSGPNVEIIDAVWDYPKVLNFITDADALISLHRAEGFGLTLAESMMVGTPIVATGWSGNIDFMDERNACLVPSVSTPVIDGQRIYRNQDWAEPDIGAAATALRHLCENPIAAHSMSERARNDIARRFSPEAWRTTLPTELQLLLFN
jgi:glycosyltransferase involved in cell wall biosynthesis